MVSNSTQFSEAQPRVDNKHHEVECKLAELYDRVYFHEAQKIRIIREIN